MMLYNWEQMNRVDQDSAEAKEQFERVKPLIKKYRLGGVSLKLFYMNHSLYRFYRWSQTTAGKVIHKFI